jgi:hypothetical protein
MKSYVCELSVTTTDVNESASEKGRESESQSKMKSGNDGGTAIIASFHTSPHSFTYCKLVPN